ncbi:hypothetical protein C7N43_08645 [Sphingobacteriales bacterium UPWRP_1]|nr:hypothetical protein BVG80_10755 [Sphingobacteriales bacterium TSM_CSM]PSJ77401.1 hypothetical protein C7N43_08645 [Sphingobacteriales bacterium UPWRP_1]
MKKNTTSNLLLLLSLILVACGNKENDSIQFYRKNQSIIYEVWQKDWKDTFKFGTDDYDTGIPYIEDTNRKLLFIFDNALFLYKINSQTGTLLDSVNMLSEYTYSMAPQNNKLLYSYPALFYYHTEVVLHLDMDFGLITNYLDSMTQELRARFPNGYRYELYIDSVRLMPPDKVWVRMNDEHGNIEVMIFGVNATMEAPVIYSTYIFR